MNLEKILILCHQPVMQENPNIDSMPKCEYCGELCTESACDFHVYGTHRACHDEYERRRNENKCTRCGTNTVEGDRWLCDDPSCDGYLGYGK